jgi:hypothetical protein
VKAVSDTSVLIALDNIGRLGLLKTVFGEVLVPEAVAREYGGSLPSWAKVVEAKETGLVSALMEILHRGDAEAIALAIQVKADLLLLDDKKARRLAARLGLRVLGTIGILILARKRGLIDDLQGEITRLLVKSFWLSLAWSTKH